MENLRTFGSVRHLFSRKGITFPMADLAIAHRLTADDVYAGYRIPAGSIVLSNLWSEAVTYNLQIIPF